MDDGLSEAFSKTERGLIITPAGCGKTEIIARAVSFSDESKGKQLILTHTHAGVKSIYDRMRKLGVSRKYYHIDTIAGFALQFAASFPLSSGLGKDFDPSVNEWDKVYPAADNVISSNYGKKVITSSFCGIYVDEYQDCTKQQHSLILKLVNYLPCRILGDPLQGIFGFHEPIVNWYEDVFPNYARFGDQHSEWTPYRWKGKNEELGIWLLQVRKDILNGKQIDFRKLPIGCRWLPLKPQDMFSQRKACLEKANTKETVVVIQHLPYQAHALAKILNGAYTSMEEVDSRDLSKWASKIEKSTGIERVVNIIEFASGCMTEISTALATVKTKIQNGEKTAKSNLKHREIFEDLVRVSEDNNLEVILPALGKIEKIPGRVLYRRELWRDMNKAIEEYVGSSDKISLQKSAWKIRDLGRTFGRAVEKRTVSRTLLIKGLEFEHCIVANADDLDAKELYVALTRGSKTLTVFSSNPIIQKALPTDLHSPKK